MKKLFAFMFLAAAMPCGAIPTQINYQGYLTRSDGSPVDTTVAMTFRLWNDDGSYVRWSETQPAVSVTDGLFNVKLGQVSPISESVLDYLFTMKLGITVGNDAEMTPLIPLASVFYARRVVTIDQAKGGTITGRLNVGWSNTNSGDSSFVTGLGNDASGGYSVVSGGASNEASGFFSCVPGGSANTASGYGAFACGMRNVASGDHSVALIGNEGVGWGCTAAGTSSLAAGTQVSVTGDRSFALGANISCAAESAFVWSDGTGQVTSIGMSRTFNIKATRGTRIWTNSDITSGVTIGAGGNAWVAVSDSTKKRNIRGLDTQDILNHFANLPLKRWEYKSEEPGVEHIGPMAQDFWNAFHLGNEPLGISTIDADGVMMAAIQELAKENAKLRTKNERLESALDAVLARVQALETDRRATPNRN